jgi:hypothetical protein
MPPEAAMPLQELTPNTDDAWTMPAAETPTEIAMPAQEPFFDADTTLPTEPPTGEVPPSLSFLPTEEDAFETAASAESVPQEPVPPAYAAPQPSEALWEQPVEEAWQMEPALAAAPAADMPEAAPELAMDRLEILGVCPLTQDKRILLVQSDQQFALMGQAGFENPNVFVLKVFESNPVAYQQTFAAAQEGQAGEQGMFVTQVGTWHAIVSTFRDQIVLHTELG